MFIRYPTRPREVSIRRILPNLITIASMVSALAAIHFALKPTPDWDKALTAVLLAAVADALDGRTARLLKVTSRFGAVLDSLVDFLAFGVTPGLIIYLWMLRDQDVWGLAAVVAFIMCAALRLARFTAAKPTRPGSPMAKFFTGMPTPAAAGAALVPLMLSESKTLTVVLPAWLVMAHLFTIGLLMISRMPMFSFKKLRVSRHWVVPLMALVGLAVVTAVKDTWLALSALAILYLCLIPVSIVKYNRLRAAYLAETRVEENELDDDDVGERGGEGAHDRAGVDPASRRNGLH